MADLKSTWNSSKHANFDYGLGYGVCLSDLHGSLGFPWNPVRHFSRYWARFPLGSGQQKPESRRRSGLEFICFLAGIQLGNVSYSTHETSKSNPNDPKHSEFFYLRRAARIN